MNNQTLLSIIKGDTIDNFFGVEEFLGAKSGNIYSSIQENTLVYVINGVKLIKLLTSHPNLGVRFYMLLAIKFTKRIYNGHNEKVIFYFYFFFFNFLFFIFYFLFLFFILFLNRF